MTTATIQTHRWTRVDYEKMVESGVFRPEHRIELVDGEIVDMTPQSSEHATAVRLAEEALREAFSPGHDVRSQLPVAIEDASEPEPDVAVVRGAPRDYARAHPRTAALIVEVADSSLEYDRGLKLRTYARSRIPEYWIVDLLDDCLEVCREPFEESYNEEMILHRGDIVSSLGCPSASIAVADLLP